jgi:hypothetical protein
MPPSSPDANYGLDSLQTAIWNRSDLDQALEDATRRHVGALVITPNPLFVTNLKHIADFAEHNRLPSIFHLREFAAVGGLVSYGVDRSDMSAFTETLGGQADLFGGAHLTG